MAGTDRSPQLADQASTLSRRTFLKGAGGIAAGGALVGREAGAEPGAQEDAQDPPRLSGRLEIELSVNARTYELEVEPRTSLLGALRVQLDPPLTGTKEVCDRGACGACTVLVDGRVAYACALLAVDCVGKEITTIEGLGTPESLSAVQEAFWKEDASQCGFCSAGLVVSTTALLEVEPEASEERVREACAGHLCRCGTYPHVFQAALRAGRELRAARERGGR